MKYKDLDIDRKRQLMMHSAALFYLVVDLAKFSKTNPECLYEYFQKKAAKKVEKFSDSQVEAFIDRADSSAESSQIQVIYINENGEQKYSI